MKPFRRIWMSLVLLVVIAVSVTACVPAAQLTPSPASPSPAQAPQAAALVFLGNKNIAPVVYLDGTKPSGVAVDIVHALAKHIPEPIEIRTMDWSEAQALVARGEADALIQINVTEERTKIYDFSDPLLESHFSIFARADQLGISDISSLRGLRVGVESGGLPQQLLGKDPQIPLTIIPSFVEGFKLLNEGAIDAVVVDYRVGSYVLAINGIRNIKVTGSPIESSYSSIAVKKGNTKLLDEINNALRTIKADGTYQRILSAWEPTEVVFETQQQITGRIYLATMLILLALLLTAVIWVVTIKKELAKRKAAEEKLREQYSTLRGIINSANALIFSVDQQYRYTSFNQLHAAVMKAMYDAEIETGHSMLEYMTVAEDREATRRSLDRALAGEQRVGEDYLGEELLSRQCFQVSHSPIKTETGEVIGVAVLAQDITERKQAEEALRQSEEKFHNVFDWANDAILLHTLTVEGTPGRFIDVNRIACHMLGYSREELLTLGPPDIVPIELHHQLGDLIRQAATKDSFLIESRILCKDGTAVPVESNAHIVDYEGQKIWLSHVRDITERKRAEEALYRMNRELRAISDCNQVLLRAADEQTLLNDICRIIHDEAGYRLLWVGYAENDDAKTVRPVAWAGFDNGYIASAQLSWADDTERGQGPAGLAIRSGEIIYIQDLATDPRMAPWRESALQRGYRSGIALPLKDESRVFGVLLIYSSEPHAFTPDEARLLEELANDLAFGITVLRARAERRRAEVVMQARLRLLELAHLHSMDELLTATLDEIEALTGSTIGFYHFLEADQRTLSLQSWSTNTLKNMCTAEGKGSHYDIAQAGVWVDCVHERRPVIHNDYASLPHRKGMPEGHAPVTREVVVPIFRGNLIKAIIGVGNKANDYNENDIEIVSQLGDLSWDIVERKRAEEALKRERTLIANIMETSPVCITVVNRDGQVTFANSQAEQTLGLSKDEIARRTYNAPAWRITDLAGGPFPDEKLPFRQVMTTRQPVYDVQHAIIWPDGRRVLLSINGAPLLNESGQVESVVFAIQDITERKRAEEVLRESEWRYREIFDNVLDGLYLLEVTDDGRFRTIQVNPALERLTGIPRSFSVGKTQEETVPTEVAAVVNAKYRRCVEAGHPIEEEVLLDLPTGQRYFHSTLIPARDETGKIHRIIGISRDITERRQAEEALRASEARFRDLYQNAPNAYFSVGVDGFIRRCNRRAGELLGYDAEKLVGRAVVELYAGTPYGKEKATKVLERFQAGETVRDEELQMQRADGTPVWISLTVSPIRDSQGRVAESRSMVVDITERKQMEELLRKREEEFRTLAENLPDQITRFDTQGCVQYINPRVTKDFGVTLEQVIGKTFRELTVRGSANDENELFAAIQQAVTRGVPNVREERWLTRRGARIFETRHIPEKDKNGKVVSILGIAKDVTELKLAEEKLRESERRYRRITEGLTDYQYSVRIENGRAAETTQSPACETVTGYSLEEFAADPYLWFRMVVPEDRELVQARVQQILAGMEIPPLEHRILRKDGSVRWVCDTTILLKDASGQLLSYDGVIKDITERKRAEEALRDSERRLTEAQRIAHIGYWERNFEAGRIILSDEACRIFGLSPQEIPCDLEQWHQRWLKLIHPEDQLRASQATVEALEGVAPYNLEYRIVRPDGEVWFIHSEASVKKDESGRPCYMLGMMQDITERKRAEEEIRKLNQELEQRVRDRTAQLEVSNKELEAFAYSVSHDLRAPLRHIDGFLDLLRQRIAATLDDQSRHYMDTISGSAQRMGLLIDDLLSFSRMGRYEMSKQQVQLGSLVQEAIRELEPDTRERSIQWRIADLPVVAGDRAMLRMVLVNLISNALKFTRPRPQAEIEIGWEAGSGAEVVVFVRDNGVGFEMTYADRLFGVFQRLHRVEEFEGTGIGLANVRRIIARHGGRTWAEGQTDHGATFYFSLPQAARGE